MLAGQWRRSAVNIAATACVLMMSMTASGPGNAQQTTPQPQRDPRQTEKSFEAFEAEQRRAKRATIRLPSAAKPEAPVDTKPLFKLTGVSVTGAHAVSGDAIAGVYRSYIGKTVSQADLATIAGKVSDLYRDVGYHLSRAIIPPQDIKGGRIRIRVIEGKIAEIVLKGERAELFGIRPMLDPVTAEHPSQLKTLERQLLLVNNRPGVRVADTALEEIGQTTGRFRLILHLETWRIFTALALDNRGTPSVGPLQAYWSSMLNSSLVVGDALGLNLSTIPDATRELGFSRLFYDMPIGIDGARLGANASYSELWPSGEKGLLNTRTRIETYELKGSIVPLQSRKSSLLLTAAASMSNNSESNSLGANYRDQIRTVSLTADYQLQDDLAGWNYLSLTLRQGVNVLGASDSGDALLSRSDGTGNFSKLEFSYTRYQKLSDIWSLKLSAAGQVASTAMLASQEFYLGGIAFGRGYDGGELSGDNGIAGSLELRFDQTLDHDFFKGYQLYSFFDKGAVWNFRDGKDDVFSLSSAGAGIRLYLASELQAGVEIAVPLDFRSPANEDRNPRVFFFLSKSFKLCPGGIHMRCS